MTETKHKRRPDDLARPQHASPGSAPAIDGPAGSALVRTLQQQAGNAAVASLMGGGAGVQRAPKLAAGDELMSPDGELQPLGRVTQPAGGAAPKTGGASTPTGATNAFESDLYDRSILNPLRAAYACVRDVPPDHAKALEHINQLGSTLVQYEERFRGTDDALANGFYAARGWLGRVRTELQKREGFGGRPMTDGDIATEVGSALQDLLALQGRIN